MPQAEHQDIEALKAKALENSPQALTLIDLQGKRLWANKAFCDLLGKNLEELLGVSVELAYPDQEKERVKRALTQETIQRGGLSNFETWFEKNGERVFVQIHTSLIRDEIGNPNAIVYSAADISAQLNRLEVLLDGLAEGVCVADSSGSIHYVNPSYAAFTGKPEEVLLQEGWHGLFPQEEWPKIARLFTRLEDEKGQETEVVSEGTYTLPGDKRRVAKRTLRPIVWEGKRRVLVSLSDITEIKHAQEKADRLRRFYEAMTELSAEGIVTATPDGRVRTANRAARDLLGLANQQAPGSVFERILPEDRESHRKWIENILQKGHGTCPGHDTTLQAKNGQTFHVLLHHGLSCFPEDEAPCVIFYIKDLTEIKAAKAKADLLLKLSPLGICEWVPGGELLEINEQYAAMVGYTKDEVFEMGWKNLTAPEYQGDPDRLHEEKALNGTDKTYRKEYIHKDGRRVPIYLVTEAIFEKDGSLSHYISYVQDLTPLVEYERLIDAILETVPAGLVLGDSHGKLYLVNKGYAQLTGKTKGELLEWGWVNLTTPEDAKKTKEVLERIEGGFSEEEVIEKTYVRGDGTKRVTQNVYRPIEYRGKRASVCCTMDITLLMEAQEKLEGHIEEQKRTIEVIEEQKRTILELSTPILPVWSKILLAPLIGSFDSMRMQRLHENLLQAAAEQKPRAVLFDLSSLAYVDTQVISEIVHLISALRLLGTASLLVGIQPKVAQGLVRLGVDLHKTPSYGTLAQGLKAVLSSAFA